jgi:RimJ/RimL family protein N-acetyltransferase
MLTLQSERLLLFGLNRGHLEQALNHLDHLCAQLGIRADPDVFSTESRQAMMIKIARMDHVDAHLHPWYTYFLLVRKEDRRAVGVSGFKGAPTPLGSVEIGYAMQEDFRNHGYMTEAVQALVDWAFQQPGCRRVTAETLRDNWASQRVLQKAGMILDHDADRMLYWKIEKPGQA